MSKMLKRDAVVPLYQQLADEIKSQIASGELKQNEQLKPEMELSKEFNVSRITVRKALELLVDEDILTKRQGIGAFVTGKKLVRSMNRMMGFTETCEANGQKASSKLLFAGLAQAHPLDLKLFGLQEGESVISIRRLRFCDDAPVLIEEVRMPRSMATLLGEDLTGSLYTLFDKYGIKSSAGSKNISICMATQEESELLQVPANTALLLIRDLSYDAEGKTIYYAKSVVNSDLYSCTVTFGF